MGYQDSQPGRGREVFEQQRRRERASTFAGLQNNLIQTLHALEQENPYQFYAIGGCGEDNRLEVSLYRNFMGEDDVHFYLTHEIGKHGYFLNATGVNTSTVWDLNIFTDSLTHKKHLKEHAFEWNMPVEEVKAEFADEFTPEEIDFIRYPLFSGGEYCTYYFIDAEGNYAKVVTIDKKFAKGRKRVKLPINTSSSVVKVESPMEDRDFALLAVVIQFFIENAEAKTKK